MNETSMTLVVLLYGFIAGGAEVLGGTFVVLRREWPARVQEYLLALSAGFLLSLVFMELVPEALHAVGPNAPLYMLAGYAVLHFFEHTIVGHLHFGEETHSEVMISRVASYSTFVGLCIHAFFDGFTIASGCSSTIWSVVLIFIAVTCTRFRRDSTIASVMMAAKHDQRTAFIASVVVGVATFAGAAGALLIGGISETARGNRIRILGGYRDVCGCQRSDPGDQPLKEPDHSTAGLRRDVAVLSGKVALETFAGVHH